MQLSLAKKQFLLGLIMFIAISIPVGFAYFQQQKMEGIFAIQNAGTIKSSLVGDMYVKLNEASIYTLEVIASGLYYNQLDKTALAKTEAALSEIENRIYILEVEELSDEEVSILEAIAEKQGMLVDFLDMMAIRIDQGVSTEDLYNYEKKIVLHIIALSGEIKKLNDNVLVHANQASKKLNENIQSSGRTQVIIYLLSLLINLPLFALVSMSISRPLQQLSLNMCALAGGDLSVEVPYLEREDEIGKMARDVQVFKENALDRQRMRDEQDQVRAKAEQEKKAEMQALAESFESEVQAIVDSVSSAAKLLSETSGSMAETVTDAHSKSENVLSASQQTSDNVNMVAAAAEEMSASVQEISSQVTNSTRVVNDAVDRASKADQHAKSLAKASQEIQHVVSLIQEVAEQIDLLALNATIESARAGEAGKGFAVVATEVKNLANQTTQATGEIAEQIQNVAVVSNDVIDILNAIREAISSVNQFTSGIASAVEEQTAVTGEIAGNMQVAAGGVNEINNNIMEVTNATTNANEATFQVRDAADLLSQQAEALNSAINSFLSRLQS